MAPAEELQPPKDYSVLSPLECNEELRAFYKALPRPDDTGIYENDADGLTAKGVADMLKGVTGGYVRRGRSDYHLRLVHNLNELLRQSPSTSTFREYVLTVFLNASTEAVLGRDIYGDDNQLTALLDLDRPGSAGIFDPDRVKEIERGVYQDHLKCHLERMTKGIEGVVRYRLNAKYQIFREYSMRLSVWSQQFLDLYGEEP